MRNPLLTLHGKNIQFIGDPHLGRRFITGIPLEKRGFFEDMQFAKFRQLLSVPCHLRVIVGDICDKAKIDEADLIRIYTELKASDPTIPIYILQGNHDDSKTTTESTSFDVLQLLLKPYAHITFVRDYYFTCGMMLIGWQFNQTIQEKLEHKHQSVTTVVTHLDKIPYGTGSNMIPFQLLKDKGVTTVVNGHEHLPWQGEIIPGLQYIGTGSMLPYDPSQQHPTDDPIFIDTTPDKLAGLDLNNKIVRLFVDDLSDVPDIPEALALRPVKRSQQEEVTILEVADYSMWDLLKKAAQETGLPDDEVAALNYELQEATVND